MYDELVRLIEATLDEGIELDEVQQDLLRAYDYITARIKLERD